MPLATGLGRFSARFTRGPMTAPNIGRLVLAGVRGLGVAGERLLAGEL